MNQSHGKCLFLRLSRYVLQATSKTRSTFFGRGKTVQQMFGGGQILQLTKSYANLRGGVCEPLYRGFFGSVQPDGCEILRNLTESYAGCFSELTKSYEILRNLTLDFFRKT